MRVFQLRVERSIAYHDSSMSDSNKRSEDPR